MEGLTRQGEASRTSHQQESGREKVLIEARSGELLTPNDHTPFLLCVDSQSGLLAASADGKAITLWRLREGPKLVCTRRLNYHGVTQDDDRITHLALDGPCLMATTNQHNLLMWRLDDLDTLDSNFLPQFQIAVLGENNVGKEKLSDAITQASCPPDEDFGGDMSLGFFTGSSDDCYGYLAGEIMLNNVRTRLKVMHNSGDAWNNLMDHAIRVHCQLVILVFDITDRSTLTKVADKWLPMVRKASGDTKVVLAGNKVDLRSPDNSDHVSRDEASEIAKKLQVDYIEMSLIDDTWEVETTKIWEYCKQSYLACPRKEKKLVEMQSVSLQSILPSAAYATINLALSIPRNRALVVATTQTESILNVISVSDSFENGDLKVISKLNLDSVGPCVLARTNSESVSDWLLVSSKNRGALSLINILDGHTGKNFGSRDDAYVCVDLDDQLVAAGNSSALDIWERESGSIILNFGMNTTCLVLDEEVVAATTPDQLHIWHRQGKEIHGQQQIPLENRAFLVCVLRTFIVTITVTGEWQIWHFV
jgi:GTPase SAR1 family protein